jgi:hypothetical protein
MGNTTLIKTGSEIMTAAAYNTSVNKLMLWQWGCPEDDSLHCELSPHCCTSRTPHKSKVTGAAVSVHFDVGTLLNWLIPRPN